MEIQRSESRSSELGHDGPPPSPPPGTPTGAEARAAANARYQAFAEGTPPPPSAPASNGNDGRVVEDTVLFKQESGDVNEVAANDVAQNHLPDCGLMATLSALASSPEGRALIHSAVVENKDSQGRTTSCTVTLYRPAWTLLGEPQTYSPVRINVDLEACPGFAIPREENGVQEVWPQVIEKAFAIYIGCTSKMNVPSNQAIEILTGRPASRVSIRSPLLGGYDGQQLVSDLNAGKLVVLTSKCIQPKDGVTRDHAFAVVGFRNVNGVPCVLVHNPWNEPDKEPGPIPLDQLGRFFDCANVGSVR